MKRRSVPGAELTTLQVGGVCLNVIEAASQAQLLEALESEPEAICIGGGSNLLIADSGVESTIIRAFSPSTSDLAIEPGSHLVRAGGTTDWDVLVQATVTAGLQGLEATSGVPGSVGGAVVQNLGAYGQEVADVIVDVDVWDRQDRRRLTLNRDECKFRYRDSFFKHDDTRRFVVLAVSLQLQEETSATPRYGDVSELLAQRSRHSGPYSLEDIRDAVLTVRARKGMVLGASLPSAGSFFTNPTISQMRADELAERGLKPIYRFDGVTLVSAAALLEASGFRRGYRRGRVGLSERHVLALVNHGNATTSEVVGLAIEVRDKVRDEFGVRLTPEPVTLGFDDDPFGE